MPAHPNTTGKPFKQDDINALGPSEESVFYNESGGTIPANTAVIIDVAGTTFGVGGSITTMPATQAGAQAFVGVTAEAIPNLSRGRVVTKGRVACVVDNVAAGDVLTADAVTAGSLDTIGGGEFPVAVALTTHATLAEVYVK